MTTLSPSSIRHLHQPSSRELRARLRSRGFEESPPGEFDDFIFAQGLLHEQRVLEELRASYPDLIDLNGFNNNDEAESETIVGLKDGVHLKVEPTQHLEPLQEQLCHWNLRVW